MAWGDSGKVLIKNQTFIYKSRNNKPLLGQNLSVRNKHCLSELHLGDKNDDILVKKKCIFEIEK